MPRPYSRPIRWLLHDGTDWRGPVQLLDSQAGRARDGAWSGPSALTETPNPAGMIGFAIVGAAGRRRDARTADWIEVFARDVGICRLRDDRLDVGTGAALVWGC